MKRKFLTILFALLLAISSISFIGVNAENTNYYVYGPNALETSMALSVEGFSWQQKEENGVKFIRCEAEAGLYQNGNLQCSFAPEDFFMGAYPIAKVSYRTNSESSIIDCTTRCNSAGESWLSSHPSCNSNGTWNEIYIDIRNMTGGGGPAKADELVQLILKPCGSGEQLLKEAKYFDIEYVAFFKNEADAKAYKYTSADDRDMAPPQLLEDFFYEKATQPDIDKYMNETDALIAEIKNSETNVNVTGQKYYVSASSGNDANDGKSPEHPWRTISRVNDENFNKGDAVFFKRGEGFRTTERLETMQGVTYSAYSEGAKPMIIASADGSDPSMWLETEFDGIYRFIEPLNEDRSVGTIVFDGGDAWGVQVQRKPAANKRQLNGNVYNGLESFDDIDMADMTWTTLDKMLVHNLEFYHDFESSTLYLYSPNGNPAELFDSVEIVDKGHGISGIGIDVLIDNIAIYGAGSHAIGYSDVKNLEVRYCEFYWIGGSVQGMGLFGFDGGVRYGNVVESYGSSDNFKIHHNYASQVYDCCWTIQNQEAVDMNNVEIYSNVSEFSNTGLEVWNGGGSITNMNLHDNYTRFNGYGWSHQRPTKDGNFFYGSSRTEGTYENNNITNNVNLFASSRAILVSATGKDRYNFHDNVYFMEEGKIFGGPNNLNYDESGIKRALLNGVESSSEFYYTDGALYENMYDIYDNFVVPVETKADLTKAFSDVKSNFWGYDAILNSFEKGYFGGVSANEFAPDRSMTRAMLAVVLSRVAGYEAEKAATALYADVPADNWYSAAVEWAKLTNIIDEDMPAFRPNDNITREELCDMLYRYALSEYKPGKNTSPQSFTDIADVTPAYLDAVKFCTQNGIVTGYTDGSVKPKNEATRAEVCTMIKRFTDYLLVTSEDEEYMLENPKILTLKGETLKGFVNTMYVRATIEGDSIKFVPFTTEGKPTIDIQNQQNKVIDFSDYKFAVISFETNLTSAPIAQLMTVAGASAHKQEAGEAVSPESGKNVILLDYQARSSQNGTYSLLFRLYPWGKDAPTLSGEEYFIISEVTLFEHEAVAREYIK